MVAFRKRTSLALGIMVLVSSAALSITFFSHSHRYTVLDDSLESAATNSVADSADTVDKILNQDEAADDWRRKAKTAALHALKLDRVRRWDEEQAQEIATEEHGWLKLAEHARNKAAKLDASWRKQQLEAKRAALLKEMKQNEQEMAQIDRIEHTLPHSTAADDSTLSSALDASSSTAGDSLPSLDASAAPRPPRKAHAAAAAAAPYRRRAAVATAAAPAKAKAGHRETIVDAVRSALGDAVLPSKQLRHPNPRAAAAAAAKRKPLLPGINAYSWWQPPAASSKRAAAKNAAAAAAAAERSKVLKAASGCHDLYSCVGSLLGPQDHAFRGHLSPGAARLEAAMRAPAKAPVKADMLQSFATDKGVSADAVRSDPDRPILNILQTSTKTHSGRLPGVATNRWGGSSFWSRLLAPVSRSAA